MNEHPVEGLMDTTMKNIRSMVDVDTIIGEPINLPDGTIIIPISKVSFGFASGGSDLPTKTPKNLFGGGSGAGVSIQPLAFLVVSDGDVKLMQMTVNSNTANGVINLVPEVIDKLTDIFGKKDKNDGTKKA
ncbi:MAG: sporulation protein YtfJ [Clostridiales bacterium]|nr:sporulation protein YtfJ [Clostridiales bacterium]